MILKIFLKSWTVLQTQKSHYNNSYKSLFLTYLMFIGTSIFIFIKFKFWWYPSGKFKSFWWHVYINDSYEFNTNILKQNITAQNTHRKDVLTRHLKKNMLFCGFHENSFLSPLITREPSLQLWIWKILVIRNEKRNIIIITFMCLYYRIRSDYK